jgi:hypothetical protein
MTIRLIPKEILEECKKEGEGLWASGKPKRWYFGIPIIVLWVAVLIVIVYKIMY